MRNFVTGKKKAFVEAYVNDVKHNQTAAAIAAGYSPKTARQYASQLMKNPEVAAAIAELEKELHEQNTAKANEVDEFLTSVMRGEEVDDWALRTRDRLKAAEMLCKRYGLFTEAAKADDNDNSGVIVIPPVAWASNEAERSDQPEIADDEGLEDSG